MSDSTIRKDDGLNYSGNTGHGTFEPCCEKDSPCEKHQEKSEAYGVL